MSKRVAVLFLTLTAVAMVVAGVLSVGREDGFDTLLYGLLLPGILAGAGVLVARKHPENPIGWLFSGFALFIALAELMEGYGYVAAATDLPAGAVGEWVITWSWIVETAAWLLIFLLFPDGRLPTRWSRVVLWVGLVGVAIAWPGIAFDSNNGSAFTAGQNPFAVEGAVVELLFSIGVTLTMAALLAAVGSIFLRLRRAHGIERQQLKWFAFAAAAMALIGPFAAAFWYQTTVVQLPMALAISAIPVTATVAILRYRLYDIDLVINRTLVYGALTATLIAAYVGSVLVLQLALSGLTQDSSLAVAGSTLAVAALFRPARSRIQRFVDRRFYRSRYDAGQTLERFGLRVREQVDIEALSADLRGVVRGTFQPAQVSLWMTPGRAP